jgi:adenosylmethionine-8-amino-7-oxononanoate aminotransferase
MAMPAGDLDRLKHDAIEKIIFHATPKEWLKAGVGPWVLDRGAGALLYDADGREYLDALSGGVFAVLTGYGREEIARAMYEQAVRLNYTSPYATTSEVTIELARKLAEVTPGDLGASFFCNSGSEGIEAAIKLARQYHEAAGEGRRYKVVSLRRELGLTYPECGLTCGTTIEQAILGSDPELVSCVVLEPVMGTAGCIVPPPGYLAAVREICDRYGVLLVSDEVVCGFGRTGRWFGVDHFDVVPDIMVVAKGLSSGYAPIAATIARQEIADRIPVFLDVHTYGGHPISAAAALENIRIIQREQLVENAAIVGAHMIELLRQLRAHPVVGDVRGLGLFMAVELVRDPSRGEDPHAEMRVDNLVAAVAREMGLFVRPLGGTILLAPPLIFTKAQAERTVDVLDAALSAVEAQVPSGTHDVGTGVAR